MVNKFNITAALVITACLYSTGFGGQDASPDHFGLSKQEQALYYAINRGNARLVATLIQNGAPVNKPDLFGPLYIPLPHSQTLKLWKSC